MPTPKRLSPLEKLPSALIDALGELQPNRCYLALLTGQRGQVQLTELDRHPVDHLFGQDLSPGFPSLAVVTPGQVVASGEPGDPPPGTTLTAVAIVYPTGAGALHLVGDSFCGRLALNAEGLVPDAMRRALGLPTRPAELSAEWFWAWAWLDELELIVKFDPPTGRLLSLGEVLCAHPSLEVEGKAQWEVGSPRGGPPPGVDLADCELVTTMLDWHREHSQMTGWTSIRRMFHMRDDVSVLSRAATWYDDGSFSRWFVAVHPSLRESLVGLRPHLSAQAMDLVEAVVLEILDRHTSSSTARASPG